MEFKFEGECGLKVVYNAGNQPMCVLSELDAEAHGETRYHNILNAQRDPTPKIHAAGWRTFAFETKGYKQRGQTVRVQLADVFGAALYLCTLEKVKLSLRDKLFRDVCELLQEPEDYHHWLQQCDWSLERLYASVEGASTFPDGPVVRLPENKTLQFPLQLFNHPLYRKAYDAAKQKLLQQYPTDASNLSLVAYPSSADEKTWKCVKEGCNETRTQPIGMVSHLTEHPEFVGLKARLITLKYNTKTEKITSQITNHAIQKPNKVTVKRMHSTEGQGPSAKSTRTDDGSLRAALDAALKLAADRDKRNDELTKVLVRQAETQAKQAETQAAQAATVAKLVDQNQKLLSLPANNRLQGPTNGQLGYDQAIENFRQFAAFQQMQNGSGN